MNADKIRISILVYPRLQKCRSGGKRAPANALVQSIAQTPDLDASAAGDDDVYAPRPLRCNVYRANHNPD